MDLGPEFFNFLVGPTWMNPVGKEDNDQPGYRIKPKRGAGKPQVTHRGLGKITAGR